jgi:flagellar protein FliS
MQLIQMLYERALQSVRQGRNCLRNRDVAGRASAICRVISILGELEGSLDYSTGGSLSRNLAKLYQYMRKRLTQANMEQSDAPLAEVESLLKTLGEGWSSICPSRTATPVEASDEAQDMRRLSATPQLAYATDMGHSIHTWTA